MGIPYTYLIGWKHHNKYYYGVRFSRNCHPSDLMVSYFTSSNTVKKFISENGLPDVVQIRKTFDCAKKARLHEEKVLRRINASGNSNFLNVANGKNIPTELCTHYGSKNGMYGKKHKKETIEKFKKPKSIETKIKMSISAKKRFADIDQTGVNNPSFKGYVVTPYGKFETLKQAAAVEGCSYGTIHNRIVNNVIGYRRMKIG